MIRFYQNSFWGVIDNAGTLEWKQFCMAPCGAGVGGSVNIVEEGDLVLNQFGNPWGNSVNIVEAGNLELNNTGQPWGGTTTTTTASPSPAPYTISFDDGDILGLGSIGGSLEISYTTGPVDGLILYDSIVTAPSWVTVDSYLEGSLDCSVSTNTGGARSGVITIKHPNNIGVTDSITISQNAAPATTQAPTTQAPTTTEAPVTLTLYDNGSAASPITFSSTVTSKLASWSISQSGSVTLSNVPSWLTVSVANLASNGGTITMNLASSPVDSIGSTITVEDNYGNTGTIWVQYDAGGREVITTTTDSGAGGGTGETTTTDSGAGGGTGETTTTSAPTDSGGGSGEGTGTCRSYTLNNNSSMTTLYSYYHCTNGYTTITVGPYTPVTVCSEGAPSCTSNCNGASITGGTETCIG